MSKEQLKAGLLIALAFVAGCILQGVLL